MNVTTNMQHDPDVAAAPGLSRPLPFHTPMSHVRATVDTSGGGIVASVLGSVNCGINEPSYARDKLRAGSGIGTCCCRLTLPMIAVPGSTRHRFHCPLGICGNGLGTGVRCMF